MLKLADTLNLPLDAVTEKLAWLGRTGSGKTYGAMKLAELMLDAGAQIGALDPVGVWRGLRVPAQKGGPSYDVVVFGGLYGDLPLQPTAGALIADVVCDRGISFVLDVSQFIPSEQQRFAKAFAERFFQRRKAQPAAIHLFMEECQEFLPQNPMGLEAGTLHEFQRLWKIGRNFGIGGSLISQRPQEINKKALNMSGTLFAFQMTAPQERKTVKEWVADHGVAEDIIGQLQKLDVGEPHVESPMFLNVSKTVRILPRITADLSSTPKVGSSKVATRPLTPIDVEQLKTAMAESIEQSKANDPRELRKTIAELKQQLAAKHVERSTAQVVSKPALTDADRALLEKLFEKLDAIGKRGDEMITAAASRLDQKVQTAVAEYLNTARNVALDAAAEVAKRLAAADFLKIYDRLGQLSGPAAATPHARVCATSTAVSTSVVPRTRPQGVTPPVSIETSTSEVRLNRLAERKILQVLAQHGSRTLRQVAIQSGYAMAGGGFRGAISKLRTLGLITSTSTGLAITEAGQGAIGEVDPLPTGTALVAHWMQQFNRLAEREVLRVVVAAHPRALPPEVIAAQTIPPYEATGGGFRGAVSKLRTLGLLEGRGELRASDVLFE